VSVYEFEVTVPAGTPADAPVSDVLQLEHGIIHRVIIDMPVGANHLVLVALDRGLHQLIPSNPSGNIASNLIPRVWDTWLPLEEEPYEITARAWSPNATYQHVIRVSLAIDRRDVLIPGQQQISFLGRLEGLLFGGGR